MAGTKLNYMKPIRILLCEDDAERRQHLQILLNGYDSFEVVGTAGCGETAVSQALEHTPEVILMDVEMPGISGIEATRRIKEMLPEARIVMYTVYEDDDKLFSALSAGAKGYLLKKTPPHRLAEAIHEVLAGGGPLSPGIAARLIASFHDTCSKLKYRLSDREREVLSYLVDGLPIKNIAREIFLTPEGVKNVLRRIYNKLQVNCGKEAVAKAVREHLV